MALVHLPKVYVLRKADILLIQIFCSRFPRRMLQPYLGQLPRHIKIFGIDICNCFDKLSHFGHFSELSYSFVEMIQGFKYCVFAWTIT